MADVHSSKTRSYNMSRIKGKDTKPEEIVRKYLFSKGFRYRKMLLLFLESRILCFLNTILVSL